MLYRVEKFYTGVIANIVKIIGFIMVITVLLQILARYLNGNMFWWTEELARLTFLWFSFLSAGIVLSKKAHLAIDFFYLKTSKNIQHILDYICDITLLLFSIAIIIYGIKLAILVVSQKSPIMGLSMIYFYLPVPLAGILFFVYILASLIDRIHGDRTTS